MYASVVCLLESGFTAESHTRNTEPVLNAGIPAGLALGIKLAGLPWQVCGVMLAGPETYYADQQTILTTSFMATYLAGTRGLLL